MKRSKYSEEQIVYALRQAEVGTPIGDVCRWSGELRRLRQLKKENRRLKRLVADLSLDKHMLSEA
jgi:putative transposase